MVQASSAYSRQQATRLSELKNSLVEKNVTAVHIVGINARHWASELMAEELTRNVNFTIYQSTRDNDHWSRLGTLKDDVLVYDRCGNLAFYLPFPHSFTSHRYVEGAILTAYGDSPCGACQPVNCNQSDSTAASVDRQSVDLECAAVDQSNCSVRHRHQSSPAERLMARCCRLHRYRSSAHQRAVHAGHRCRCLPVGAELSCVCSHGLPTEAS